MLLSPSLSLSRCRLFVAAAAAAAQSFGLLHFMKSAATYRTRSPHYLSLLCACMLTSVYVCLGRRLINSLESLRVPSAVKSHNVSCSRPSYVCVCVWNSCHKLQLKIVRNYIKFLLPHMKWKRCCCSFPNEFPKFFTLCTCSECA